MIRGEHDMNELLWGTLNDIQIDTARTGDPEALAAVPIYAVQPDESVVPNAEDGGTANYPAITFFHFDDVSIEGRPLRHQGDQISPVDPNDLSQGYEVYDHPIYRRLSYQVDLHTRNYQDMLYLQQELFSRLRREFGALTDNDGTLIYYRLTDVADQSRNIDDERFYRRALTYSFDAWVWPSRDPKGTIGAVHGVTTEVRDMDDEDELYFTIDVPET